MYLHIIAQITTEINVICRYTFLYFLQLADKIYTKANLQVKACAGGGVLVTVNDAVAKRVFKLLQERGMSQYRLEQESGIQHGSMQCIMNGRNKTVTLSTVMLLARGFGMSLVDFLGDDIFLSEDLEIEQ